MNNESFIAPAVPFGSVEKLVGQIERMFDCRDGDYRAWHTDPVTFESYPYIVLGVTTAPSVIEAPEKLRQMLYTAFHKLKRSCTSERPTLYWRYAKEGRIQEEEWVSIDGPGMRHKIRTRIAVPEANFEVVKELVKEDEASYKVLRE